MSIQNYLNPGFVYNNRELILPTLRRLPYDLWFYIRFKAAQNNIFISNNERKLVGFKDQHKGKRCFLIGNGPSLKVADLDRLKGEISFAANKIYLAFDQTAWRPSYYLVVDELVGKQNFDAINNLQGFPKFFPTNAISVWNTVFDNSVYFRFRWVSPSKTPKPPGFSFDAMDKIFSGKSVVYSMMQLAFYMGIRQMYLIGMDFDFKITSQKDSRCLISSGENNHFHPDYRKTGEKWNEPFLEYQEKAFQLAHSTLSKAGGAIWNVTRGGKLTVFPRVDFDTLFDS